MPTHFLEPIVYNILARYNHLTSGRVKYLHFVQYLQVSLFPTRTLATAAAFFVGVVDKADRSLFLT